MQEIRNSGPTVCFRKRIFFFKCSEETIKEIRKFPRI